MTFTLYQGLEDKFAIDDFIDNIEIYLRDDVLREYKRVVKKPICFGEIITKLILCEYNDFAAVVGDVDTLVQNCAIYWSKDRGNMNIINVTKPRLIHLLIILIPSGGNGGGPDNVYIKDAEKLRAAFVEKGRQYIDEMEKKGGLGKRLVADSSQKKPAGSSSITIKGKAASSKSKNIGKSSNAPSSSSSSSSSISAVLNPVELSTSSVDDTTILFDTSAANTLYGEDLEAVTNRKSLLQSSTKLSLKLKASSSSSSNSKPQLSDEVKEEPLSLSFSQGVMAARKAKKEKDKETVVTSPLLMMPPAGKASAADNSAAVAKRSEKYLKATIKVCLTRVKDHFMINATSGMKVSTSFPFLKAVDPTLYPDYATVVMNPMDLARMEKKLNGDKYSSIPLVVADIELIKQNAYIYNTGINGLEVRIMADALVNFFKYLLKSCMRVLQSSGDTAVIEIILNGETRNCLNLDSSEITKDVSDYLKLVGSTGEQLVGRASLLSLTINKESKEASSFASDFLPQSQVALSVPSNVKKAKPKAPVKSIEFTDPKKSETVASPENISTSIKMPAKKKLAIPASSAVDGQNKIQAAPIPSPSEGTSIGIINFIGFGKVICKILFN